MMTSLLVALALVLADAPVAAPAAVPAPAATTPAAPAAPPAAKPVDPVTAEINALMSVYKDKSGDPVRGKLGFSIGRRPATDGEVVFWDSTIEQPTNCGMDMATGAMRCIRPEPFRCRIAVAFDTKGILKAWAVTGPPEVCRGFITLLKAP
jgi:hypothetical protein